MASHRLDHAGNAVPAGQPRPRPARRSAARRFRSSAAWQRLAAAQIRRQPWCSGCGHPGSLENPLTADHIVPAARGGAHAAANLTTLCRICNSAKGARARTESGPS